MKQTGTGNRFDVKDKEVWMDNDKCWECLMNQPDCLHHIICNSCKSIYTAGNHNSSILNSAPLHNYSHPNSQSGKTCHIGNEAHLYKEETIRKLLKKTYQYLLRNNYKFKDKDLEFMKVYKKYYI